MTVSNRVSTFRRLSVAAVFAAACHDRVPARLSVGADTLILNGKTPVALPVRVFNRAGYQLADEDIRSTLSSDSAMHLEGNALACVKAGDGEVTVTLAALRATRFVRVAAPIALATVRLAPGERRGWQLSKGRYRISLNPVAGFETHSLPRFQSGEANCARDPVESNVFHCVVYAHATVLVRNAGIRRRDGDVAAEVRIVRTP